MTVPVGSLVVFACDAGKTADDLSNNGRNGIFTECILQHIGEPNLTIEEIMNRVCEGVATKTENAQAPFRVSLLRRAKIYFNYQKGKDTRTAPLRSTEIHSNAKWIQNGVTVAGGNGQGNELNQLSHPWGLYIDDDQNVYIADQLNHRITEWKCDATMGQVVAGGNGSGNGAHQLNCPTDVIVDESTDSLIICDRDNRRLVVRWPRGNGRCGETIISDIECVCLTMDNNGSLSVTDNEKHAVIRYRLGESQGTVVAGGNGRGNRLDQLNEPRYIFVDHDHSVYVSNNGNNFVVKWIEGAKQGSIVISGQEKGNGLAQLSFPQGVVVDQLGTAYVADGGNNRIMRWPKDATEGDVIIGGNGQGGQSNQLNWPFGLSLDRQGIPTILDTDIGTDYDDQMALTYILSNPTIFDLKLVVCSTHNTTARAQIAAKTLSIFGRFDVPIAIGRSIGTQNMPEYEWAQDYTLDLFKKDGGTVYEDGEQALLRELLNAHPNNIYHIIEISPETSLGDIIHYIDPDILRCVRLFAMAGSIYVGYGNSSHPSKEYNIVVDVHASQTVFNSPWAYFGLAPLDTTIFMQFYGQEWLNFISFTNQSKHVQLVIDSYTTWYNNGGKSYGALKPFSPQTGTSTMYDVLAAFLAAYYPATFSMITKNLPLIVTNDGYTTINSTLGKQVNASIAFTTPDPYLSTQSIGAAVLNSIISS